MITALKTDLENFQKGLEREKYNLNKVIEKMLEYEAQIECTRNKLYYLGINTERVRPWGK